MATLGLAFQFIWKLLYQQLEDKNDREKLLERLTQLKGRERYTTALNLLREWLNDFFRPALSHHAFGRCYVIAFAYPLFFYIITWVLVGGGELAGGEALPDLPTLFARLGYSVALFAGVALSFLLWRHSEPISVRLATVLPASWRQRPRARDAIDICILVGMGIGGLILARSVGGIPGIVVFAGMILATGHVTLLATIVVFILIQLSLVLVFQSPIYNYLLVFLFVILPLINAMLDWWSGG